MIVAWMMALCLAYGGGYYDDTTRECLYGVGEPGP